jgi:endonuclease/exonuclease/phosphatase family metal-dependent hydrolase
VFALRLLVVVFSALLVGSTSAVAQTLPSGWSSTDIGSVGAAGVASGSTTSLSVDGAGADVWGYADAFRFVYTKLTGDGSVVTRVASLEYVNAWTKAGVMMRESLSANSRHASMFVSPGKGLAFQRRATTGGASTHTSGGSGAAPSYVKLTRVGTTFTAYKSADGKTWTKVGSQSLTLPATIYVGTVVSSHVRGVLASALFQNTSVARAAVTTTTTATTAPTTTSSRTLRVLHWNTRHGGLRTDGVYDPVGLANWIIKMNPDVMSLNEVESTPQIAAILGAIKARTGVTWTYEWDNRGNLVASKLPRTGGSDCLVNAGVGRKAAHMAILVNGKPLNLWSGHFSLDGSSVRQAEVKALVACARNWPEARIYAGDFNTWPSAPEYDLMASVATDAWLAAKALGTATTYAGNCDGCTRNGRIDWVFTSNGTTHLKVKSAQVYDTRNSSGAFASDHKPLLVVYEVR